MTLRTLNDTIALTVTFDTRQRGRHLCWNFEDDATHTSAMHIRGEYAGSIHLPHASKVQVILTVFSGHELDAKSVAIEQISISTLPRSTSDETTHVPSPFLNNAKMCDSTITLTMGAPTVKPIILQPPLPNYYTTTFISTDPITVSNDVNGIWETSMTVTARYQRTGRQSSSETLHPLFRKVFTFDPEAEVGTVRPHD
jgi:hypothetical protein